MCMITPCMLKIIIMTIDLKYFLHKGKFIITARVPKLFLKMFYFFSLMYIRMSGKNINFDNRKQKK